MRKRRGILLLSAPALLLCQYRNAVASGLSP